MRCRDLHRDAGCRHARAHLDADRGRPFRLPRHPQRGDLDCGLFHGARWPEGDLPADLPLCLSPVERCRAVLASRCWAMAASARRTPMCWTRDQIADGRDELGVLLYGHKKNAYWFGSQLSIEEARKLAPYQSATGLQVTSAVLTGMIWAIENPLCRHRRDGRDGLPPLPRNPDALSGPGARRLHRLDAARLGASSSSPPISTARIPGSSRIFWCAESSASHGRVRPGA